MAVPGSPMKQNRSESMGGKSQSLLDGIITGVFGPDTSAMSEQDAAATERARQKDRNEAYALAESARTNPGASFMGGPNMSGSGDMLKTLVKIFAGGAG